MDKYYYFASELSLLTFGQETHINLESFLEEAEKWMSRKDFTALTQADIDNFYPDSLDTGLLRDYKNFEKALRSDLASKRGPNDSLSGRGLSHVLEPATLEGSPLEIEKKLLLLRWKFIEIQEAGNYFNLEFFILYFLKLQILQKLFIFDKEKGLNVFDGLCEVYPVRDRP